jgi:hypothetical protein
VVVINKILCLAFLLSYADPLLGVTRPLLAVFFNKKWFFCSQGKTNITFIAGTTIGGLPVLYGTDGTKFYKMFSDTTSSINTTVKTKLWDFGEQFLDKQVLKTGVETSLPVAVENISLTVDSEYASNTATLTATNLIDWVNATGTVVPWTNNSGTVIGWLASGFVWFRGDVSNYGKYIGLTFNSTSAGMDIISLQAQYELRARW